MTIFSCSENHRYVIYVISIMLIVIKRLPYFGYQDQIKQGFGNTSEGFESKALVQVLIRLGESDVGKGLIAYDSRSVAG